MRGLYAIVDVGSLERRGLDPVRFAESVLAARPAALQLRDKDGAARRTLALLRALVPPAAQAGVPFFANDRPDLARLAGCSGVHVGQDDVPVALVRSLGIHQVGLSTHSSAQVEAALAEGPDYLAIGPIYPTASKDRPSPVVGLATLATLAAHVRATRPGLPIVAIGGVTLENAGEVGVHADAAAVIQALLPEETGEGAYAEVTARARALHAAICGKGGGS